MRIDPKLMRFAAAMSSAVIAKGFVIFAGYWLGNKMDIYFGTSPLFLLVCMLFGVVLGMTYLLVVFNKTKP